MTAPAARPPVRHHLPPVAVGLLIVFAFVGFFTSALHNPQPRDIKLAVVAPEPVLQQLQSTLQREVPHGFSIKNYATAGAATKAVLDQDVQGAYIADTGEPQLVIASADGFAITEVLEEVFQPAAVAAGQQLTVHDVAPLPGHDSKGLSTFLVVAGTTLGSLLFSAVLFLLASGAAVHRRFLTILSFTALAGILAAITTHYVANGLGGPFWAVAGILALLSAAVTLTTAAVIRLVGSPGIGLCLAGLALFALPGSGGPLGYEFLPAGYHRIAAGLPSTATVSALRGAVYFHGHGTLSPMLVLLAWIAAATVLYTLAAAVRDHPHPPFVLRHLRPDDLEHVKAEPETSLAS